MLDGNVDILKGKPEKAIMTLAIPILIYLLISNSYNIIDGMWISGIGKAAITGVGSITPLFNVVNGVAMGIGAGATSAISYFIGLNDKDKADNVGVHTIILSLVIIVILSILIVFSLKYYLGLYHIDADAVNQAMEYGIPLFSNLYSFVFLGVLTGILRGEGETKKPMIASSIGLILNAILDPILIYNLNMGVMGAAVSTILTSILSVLILSYWVFVKKSTYLKFSFKSFKFDLSIIKKILSVGIPASIELFIMNIATTLYLMFISSISGNYGIAVFTAGNWIYYLGIMPITATCFALVPVVGNALGAGDSDKIKKAYKYGCKGAVILGTLIAICIFVFAQPLSLIFANTSQNSDMLGGLVLFIRIVILCLPFLGIGLPSTFLYQGLGKGVHSLMWTLMRELLFSVFFTYLFGIVLSYGLTGIWVGLVVGRTLANILNYIFANHTLNHLNLCKNDIDS
ncbi:MAG: MATE family efflux transporter [Methanobrevibacter sp.]|nr:MATE family efflux transporter [Methanobrevibacter sp.]